jgi:hypothetical protein
MPLEVRELVVKVNVGADAPSSARPPRWDDDTLETLKREVIEACLADLRRRTRERDER